VKVFIGCEFSGVVRRAFRDHGHDAYSCDLLPAEDNSPHHIQGDVLQILSTSQYDSRIWDLAVFFPPCTHLAVSGARWFKQKKQEQVAAILFFTSIYNLPMKRLSIENPIGIMSTLLAKPDQIIQPWQFGHGETKATCLWLRNLPKLEPTEIVEGRTPRVHHEPPSPDRWKNRSRTLVGIAEAMASQWGSL
jgi:hypothetical protein